MTLRDTARTLIAKTLIAAALITSLTGCAAKRGAPLLVVKPEKSAAIKEIDTRTLIVIDPGHGGDDDGAKSHGSPRCEEKNLALATAKMVESYLKKMGYRTYMTREVDTFIALKERAKISNAKMPSLFVSIHYNSAPSKQANGIEVFYYKSDSDKSRSLHSKRCAEVVLDHVIKQTEARSRGVKHGNFAVIRETTTPAILIEGGFVTNQEEMDKIRSNTYMQKLAFGIATGISKFIHPLGSKT